MHQFISDESGATAIEYGLIAALISVIIIAGLTVLNAAMVTMYSSITDQVNAANGTG